MNVFVADEGLEMACPDAEGEGQTGQFSTVQLHVLQLYQFFLFDFSDFGRW